MSITTDLASLCSHPSRSTDASAADPRIDALRAKIYCVEEKRFSEEYHEPSKRSIGNALLVELNDGTVLDEVEIEYPVGHKRRRAEGTPLLINKFKRFFRIISMTDVFSHLLLLGIFLTTSVLLTSRSKFCCSPNLAVS